MFFDGASRTGPIGKVIVGVGVVFVSPKNHVLPRVFSLTEPCSNNAVEHNALLIGLYLAQQMGVQYLKAYGDSKLIINQVMGEYEVYHEDLIPYHHAAINLADSFNGFYISHVSRLSNTKTDALAALAATLTLPADTAYYLMVTTHHPFCPKFGLEVSKVHITSTNFEQRDWRFLTLTTLCMAYCPIIIRKWLLFDEDLLGSTMMQW